MLIVVGDTDTEISVFANVDSVSVWSIDELPKIFAGGEARRPKTSDVGEARRPKTVVVG